MTPTHFIRVIFFTQGRAQTNRFDRGRVAERLPQFTVLLRRLRPKNTSPARNEVVYEEETPMLNLLSRLALLIPFATTRGHTLKALSSRERVRAYFFSRSFFLFVIVSRTLHPRAVSSRSTNPGPVCTSNSRVSGLSHPPRRMSSRHCVNNGPCRPVAGSRWDRKHIRPAFARDFSPVFVAILCGCLIRVSAHIRSSFVCRRYDENSRSSIESFFFLEVFL